MSNLKTRSSNLFLKRQAEICAALEQLDGKQKFQTDRWDRIEGGYGGGGVTRILQDGAVIEKGGVNFSEVHGELSAEMCSKIIGVDAPQPFYATGISLVIHPFSPMVPTVHANFRYLEVADKKWFGGGADLTPYYYVEQDAIDFHSVLRAACDSHNPEFYPRFKKWCDEYFFLPHRQEARGIGGLFFDYLGKDDSDSLESLFPFIEDVSGAFIEAYLPIAGRHKDETWTPQQKEFQLYRRGRYVEFNLLYDRGTQFGLKTGGRTESILMSLPKEVRWGYNLRITPNTPEAELLTVLQNPRDWV